MSGLLPWAIAGLVGWAAPKVFGVKENWAKALLAALAGALVGYLL